MGLPFTIAPDVAAEIGRWRAYLGAERRMSPKTLEAYERDAERQAGALAATRAPKPARTLPKPLAASAAKQTTDTDLRAGEDRETWILARDAAVLALLYGSGLRISEALGLKRSDANGKAALAVVGKGNKTRKVPVLPLVTKA